MPTKFDFISPGIQLREVDQSQVPPQVEKDGLLLIGRARRGPAMKPIKVNNLNDFVEVFGLPIDGVRQNDAWRNGNTGAPNYAAYAAQAYLAAGIGPVKYVRLLGKSQNGVTTGVNAPGWTMGSNFVVNPLRAGLLGPNAAAYGLVLVPSGSGGGAPTVLAQYDPYNVAATGTLAAIFYVSGSGIALKGTQLTGNLDQFKNDSTQFSNIVSASTLIKSNADSWGFTLALSTSVAAPELFTINFDESSPNYIRKVLNTDPTLFYNSTNYGSSLTNESYFLGETFDVNVSKLSQQSSGKVFGMIVGLGQAGSANYDDYRQELTAAKSSWFISQRPYQKYLFQLIALDDGEDFQNKYYVRIKDVVLATVMRPDAGFTLQIVKKGETVLQDSVVEEFTNCTMNDQSQNYISKKIGDINTSWNASENKFDVTGLYPNKSNYVRVSIAQYSEITPGDVPVGFLGPAVPSTITVKGDGDAWTQTTGSSWIHASSSIAIGNECHDDAGTFFENVPMVAGWPRYMTASIEWPNVGMTTANSKMGSQNYTFNEYFGLRHVKSTSQLNDKSYQDIIRGRKYIDMHIAEQALFSSAGFVFTLEDVVSSSSGASTYYWSSGSYYSSASVAANLGFGGNSGLIKGKRIKQFSVPFYGGADGIDIRYADPFSNYNLSLGSSTYPFYTLDTAMEMVRDPENIRYELISVPGLVNGANIDKVIDIATQRADALAVIDLDGIYRATWDNNGTVQNATLNTVVSTLNTRTIDSSYACTYFPNVRMKDTMNGNEQVMHAPPSVAAIGALAKSERMSQPWFAPAGFNRGGLSRLGGSNGPVVVGTSLHLTKDNRDTLYDATINPIARFPATGDIVVFGQKTMQQIPSALDRINVRRMMIYLKRHIGDIADTILFDQNVEATWSRFKTRAEKILENLKSDLGVTDYKLVLDSSTTTADLIDRNIMYAKIFVKPARAIEFIAIDFIITRSGVEF
tara:strand:- start:943 stop:3855 length:2913 start_codon:yes stop_codon:yes gene_type:complete